jgi:hypothetical protein
MSARHLRFEWTGYEIIHAGAVGAQRKTSIAEVKAVKHEGPSRSPRCSHFLCVLTRSGWIPLAVAVHRGCSEERRGDSPQNDGSTRTHCTGKARRAYISLFVVKVSRNRQSLARNRR